MVTDSTVTKRHLKIIEHRPAAKHIKELMAVRAERHEGHASGGTYDERRSAPFLNKLALAGKLCDTMH